MNKYNEPGNPDQEGYPPALDGTTDENWFDMQDADNEWIEQESEK